MQSWPGCCYVRDPATARMDFLRAMPRVCCKSGNPSFAAESCQHKGRRCRRMCLRYWSLSLRGRICRLVELLAQARWTRLQMCMMMRQKMQSVSHAYARLMTRLPQALTSCARSFCHSNGSQATGAAYLSWLSKAHGLVATSLWNLPSQTWSHCR